MVSMKQIIISMVLLWVSHLAMATVSMDVETKKIQEGESFKITLTLDGDEADSVPDLTPLQEDFNIDGTERSMNYTVINGQAHSLSQWIILVTPKKTGVVEIPALQVGSEKTQPATIEVSQESTGKNKGDIDNQQDIRLITEINEPNPYVNQQAILTVKLLTSRRLIDVDYQPPKLQDGILIPIGSGNQYQTMINGTLYAVEEQKYAFFSQKSGAVQIQPPLFRALVYNDVAPKRVTARAKPITVQVKAIPSQYTGTNWLPAKGVTLSEQFDNNSSTVDQGGTLVRTVQLQAVGIPAQLLPSLDFASNAHSFSVYPDKASQRNSLSQGNLVGHSIIKVNYLFNKSGTITIPELKLHWFNTTTAKEETAILPAHIIDVRPAPGHSQAATIAPQNKAPKTVSSSDAKTSAPSQNTPKRTALNGQWSDLGWWVAALFALAWIVTLLLLFRKKPDRQQLTAGSKEYVHYLQEACAQNNPHAARDALIQWARHEWPKANILNLTQVANLLHQEEFLKEIHHLTQVLYGESQRWQGAALWQAFLSHKKIKHSDKENSSSLPGMHKL
ncbi:protein BatD [Legionella jordanis]|nr:protein BatD [Legionella jordanis]RMX21240.1 protein BatD [Legionella jordanis]